MTTQQPMLVPEPWPPNDWPACPDPARYKDAMERVQKNLERSGGWMGITVDPENIQGELEDDQFIMSEIIASRMSYEHAMRIVRAKSRRTTPTSSYSPPP